MNTHVDAELERAATAATASEALIALCAAWKVAPSTRIAVAARALAAQLPRKSIAGDSQEKREAAWLEMAENASVLEVQTLLATPWPTKPKEAAARLSALERLGPDPRVVGALLELDSAGRYAGAAGTRFWAEVYALLLKWGSVEAAQNIPRDLHAASVSELAAARFARLFEPLVITWQGRWPTEPSLSPRAMSFLERIEAQLKPRKHVLDGLVRAVHQSPLDDAPRLVLADALSEQGDPRGDFITLQFANEASELTLGERERMQRLVAASGRAWFDGLERQIGGTPVFRRGFIDEVRLETRTPDASISAWRTVEVIDTAGLATALSGFIDSGNLVQLHTLRGLRGATFHELAANAKQREFRLLEIAHLGERDIPEPKWRTSALRLSGGLDQIAWWLRGTAMIIRSPVLQLSVDLGFDRVGPTIAELENLTSGTVIVELAAAPPDWPMLWHGDWSLRFTRDERGRFSDLEISIGSAMMRGLNLALNSIVPGQLKKVAVTTLLRRGPNWRESTGQMIRDYLRMQPGLELSLF